LTEVAAGTGALNVPFFLCFVFLREKRIHVPPKKHMELKNRSYRNDMKVASAELDTPKKEEIFYQMSLLQNADAF